jgi:hypothetical protein
MERLIGQSYKTLFYREYYHERLRNTYTEEYLDSLTDAEIETLLVGIGLLLLPLGAPHETDFESRLMISAMKKFYHNILHNSEVGVTMGFLDWR